MERQNIGRFARQRMYLSLLVALAEDLPFCILNMMLVLVPRRDKLICSEASLPDCERWLEEQGTPTLVLLIFMTSVAALTYKLTQLTLFPKIWSEHKEMEREAQELDARAAELVVGLVPAKAEEDGDELGKLGDPADSDRSNPITRDEWPDPVESQKKAEETGEGKGPCSVASLLLLELGQLDGTDVLETSASQGGR